MLFEKDDVSFNIKTYFRKLQRGVKKTFYIARSFCTCSYLYTSSTQNYIIVNDITKTPDY